MCGTDDGGGVIGAWQDEALQYDQYPAYRIQSAACDPAFYDAACPERDLVGGGVVVYGERGSVCGGV